MWSPRRPTRPCAAGRGGMVLSNDEDLGKKINSAAFPGLQGGPLMHSIASKAAAFGEALKPSSRPTAQTGGDQRGPPGRETLKSNGFDIVSGGTDTHLMLVDLRPKGLTGNGIARRASIGPASPATRTACPSIPEKPTVTSGIRLGTPAALRHAASRRTEFRQVGRRLHHPRSRRLGGQPRGQQRRGAGGARGGGRVVPPFPDLSGSG